MRGIQAVHLLPEGDTRRWGKFDYHFWVDFGEDSFNKEACKWQPPTEGKSIYVVSDNHLDETGYRLEKAAHFDYIFVNQKYYIEEFVNAYYLPHAAEPMAYPKPKHAVLPKYDLCFIGHMQEQHSGNGLNVTRLDALEDLFKAFPNFYFGTRNPAWPEKNMFEDAAARFSESKIVFNISVGNDVNMRFFEVLSTGSFLLTNKIPELKSLEDRGLDEGVHYVAYTSMKDAIGKARYFIEHEKERKKIARAGYQAFKNGHTYKHRIQEIFKSIG